MNNYVEYLVLAYFRQLGQEYNLYDLKERIGISIRMLNEILDDLFNRRLLEYKDNLIVLSKEGRLALSNSDLEEYTFDEEEYFEKEDGVKWPLEKVYVVHAFSKNKWRGSENSQYS